MKQLIDNPFVNKAEDPLKPVRVIQYAVMNTSEDSISTTLASKAYVY
jgi:hypothetical protein